MLNTLSQPKEELWFTTWSEEHPCTKCDTQAKCATGYACKAFANNMVHGKFEGFNRTPTKELYVRWLGDN